MLTGKYRASAGGPTPTYRPNRFPVWYQGVLKKSQRTRDRVCTTFTLPVSITGKRRSNTEIFFSTFCKADFYSIDNTVLVLELYDDDEKDLSNYSTGTRTIRVYTGNRLLLSYM